MTINTRNATYRDAPAIKSLLEGLGYRSSLSLLLGQLENVFGQDDHHVFVCERDKEVTGFASVHFLPQLAFDGGLLLISYFAVDDNLKDERIGTALERHITAFARQKKCERIQVHCADWRTPMHRFYLQQGYQEYPKYFTKRLIYGE